MTIDVTRIPSEPRKPNWGDWKSASKAKLWHAVALACEMDPSNFPNFDFDKLTPHFDLNYPTVFASLLTLAKHNLGANGILKATSFDLYDLEGTEISLRNFATWLKSINHQLPAEFPWVPEEMPLYNLDWPWGRHETDLLRKLAAAANRFWKNYDPSDPSTAPTNQEVAEWLKKEGVAERNANVIATILRPDGLQTGPRR